MYVNLHVYPRAKQWHDMLWLLHIDGVHQGERGGLPLTQQKARYKPVYPTPEILRKYEIYELQVV